MTKELLILQAIIPSYRVNFFTLLSKEFNGQLMISSTDSYSAAKAINSEKPVTFLKIKSYNLLNNKLIFNSGNLLKNLFAHKLVMELNPRIVSNWLLLLLRKIIGKKTILWGHAWPIRGRLSKSDKVRHLMRLLSDSIICYTKAQEKELKELMPNKYICSAPNSLFYKKDMRSDVTLQGNNIIYVGRLVASKKPSIAIRAFSQIKSKIPSDCNLIIVGGGQERCELEDLIVELKLSNRVKLMGHISDYTELKELYSQSIFSISPGYIGLSITQSFSFGVPMLISRDENHSPEIECAAEGENSIFFKTDDVYDFGKHIIDIFKHKDSWAEKRGKIQEFCRNNYSVENMVAGYLKGVGE